MKKNQDDKFIDTESKLDTIYSQVDYLFGKNKLLKEKIDKLESKLTI